MKNLKMVASDIDGTLLPYGQTRLTDALFTQIDALHRAGIRFVAASGRSYDSMHRLFEKTADEILYIAANGACIWDGDELLFAARFTQQELNLLTDTVFCLPEAWALVFQTETGYAIPEGSVLEGQKLDGVNPKLVPWGKLPENLCKVALRVPDGTVPACMPQAKKRFPGLTAVCGGSRWIDLTPDGVTKGSALVRLMKRQNITARQLATFGDNENDAAMLRLTPYGYAVENAAVEAKNAAAFICEDVCTVLQTILQCK